MLVKNILDKHGIECVKILGRNIGTTIIPRAINTLRIRLMSKSKYISFQSKNIVLSKPRHYKSHNISHSDTGVTSRSK